MLDEGCANFTMSSSLPPMVMGDVAGEVELSVPFLYLKPGVLRPSNLRNHKSGPLFAVRVKWWGDSGPGTVLKPGLLNIRDEKGEKARRANLTNATRALFPVRCDLDGLVTYLKDMVRIREQRVSDLHNYTHTMCSKHFASGSESRTTLEMDNSHASSISRVLYSAGRTGILAWT